MSAWYEPKEVAAGKYASFVAERARWAMRLSDRGRFYGNVAFINDAIEKLGEAYHSYSDSLSPSHGGFQPWYGPVDGPTVMGYAYKAYLDKHHNQELMDKYDAMHDDVVFHVNLTFKWVLNYVLQEY